MPASCQPAVLMRSSKSATPSAIATDGSTASMTGMLATSGPAWYALSTSSTPSAVTGISEYGCHEVNRGTMPCVMSATVALSSADCSAITPAAARA